MAQTIQIKNGTGSSAPATLLQGELAINVSSGSLWYGSGSSNATHSNWCFGEITASNKIRNHLGNHTGTGAITASGTITAGSIRLADENAIISRLQIKHTSNITHSSVYQMALSNTVGPSRLQIHCGHTAASRTLGIHMTSSNLIVGANGSQEWGIGPNRDTGRFRISPGEPGDAAALEIDKYGAITASSHITTSGTVLAGALDIEGNVDIDGTLEADAITVGGTGLEELVGTFAADSANTATTATTATNTTNIKAGSNAEDEQQFVAFLDNGDNSFQQIRYDGGLRYNPSQNKLELISGHVSSSGAATSSGVHISPTKAVQTSTGTATAMNMVDSNMYSYQYIPFYGQDAGVSGSWMGPGNSGISNHIWSATYGAGDYNYEKSSDFTVGVSQISCSNPDMHPMIHVPMECELVGFTGTVHKFNGAANGPIYAGLFVTTGSAASFVPGAPNYGVSTPQRLTLQAVATASTNGEGFNQRTNHIEDLSRSTTLPAGAKIWPGVFTGEADNVGDNFRMNFTIVLRTKIGI